MIMITKLIMLGIAVVCILTLTFIVLEFVEDKVMSKFLKKRNRVHFYVARDKDGSLWLYIGKPIRSESVFASELNINFAKYNFHILGLNENDYANLKWEDEPVEVFLNMED